MVARRSRRACVAFACQMLSHLAIPVKSPLTRQAADAVVPLLLISLQVGLRVLLKMLVRGLAT